MDSLSTVSANSNTLPINGQAATQHILSDSCSVNKNKESMNKNKNNSRGRPTETQRPNANFLVKEK